jgi:hypothetical protein
MIKKIFALTMIAGVMHASAGKMKGESQDRYLRRMAALASGSVSAPAAAPVSAPTTAFSPITSSSPAPASGRMKGESQERYERKMAAGGKTASSFNPPAGSSDSTGLPEPITTNATANCASLQLQLQQAIGDKELAQQEVQNRLDRIAALEAEVEQKNSEAAGQEAFISTLNNEINTNKDQRGDLVEYAETAGSMLKLVASYGSEYPAWLGKMIDPTNPDKNNEQVMEHYNRLTDFYKKTLGTWIGVPYIKKP